MKTLTAIIAAAVLSSACAHTPTYAQRYAKYEPYLGEPVNSITALTKDSWEPISRTQLVLYTTFNTAYLLTVTGDCPELPYTRAVGVTSTTSQITTLDSVIVRGYRCPIEQIQPIDIRRMKADRNAGAADEEPRRPT
jgi:uncharacterized protein DUF6491